MELVEVDHTRIHEETRGLDGFLIQKNGWRFFYSLVIQEALDSARASALSDNEKPLIFRNSKNSKEYS